MSVFEMGLHPLTALYKAGSTAPAQVLCATKPLFSGWLGHFLGATCCWMPSFSAMHHSRKESGQPRPRLQHQLTDQVRRCVSCQLTKLSVDEAPSLVCIREPASTGIHILPHLTHQYRALFTRESKYIILTDYREFAQQFLCSL